jgi:hypothetical protein
MERPRAVGSADTSCRRSSHLRRVPARARPARAKPLRLLDRGAWLAQVLEARAARHGACPIPERLRRSTGSRHRRRQARVRFAALAFHSPRCDRVRCPRCVRPAFRRGLEKTRECLWRLLCGVAAHPTGRGRQPPRLFSRSSASPSYCFLASSCSVLFHCAGMRSARSSSRVAPRSRRSSAFCTYGCKVAPLSRDSGSLTSVRVYYRGLFEAGSCIGPGYRRITSRCVSVPNAHQESGAASVTLSEAW